MATTRLALGVDRRFAESSFLPGFLEAPLGRLTDLTQIGVNVVRLAPGARSSSRHWHEAEIKSVRPRGVPGRCFLSAKRAFAVRSECRSAL